MRMTPAVDDGLFATAVPDAPLLHLSERTLDADHLPVRAGRDALEAPVVEPDAQEAEQTRAVRQGGEACARSRVALGLVPGVVDARPDDDEIGRVPTQPDRQSVPQLGRTHPGDAAVEDRVVAAVARVEQRLELGGVGLIPGSEGAVGVGVAHGEDPVDGARAPAHGAIPDEAGRELKHGFREQRAQQQDRDSSAEDADSAEQQRVHRGQCIRVALPWKTRRKPTGRPARPGRVATVGASTRESPGFWSGVSSEGD
jgi:hypothetical protein